MLQDILQSRGAVFFIGNFKIKYKFSSGLRVLHLRQKEGELVCERRSAAHQTYPDGGILRQKFHDQWQTCFRRVINKKH